MHTHTRTHEFHSFTMHQRRTTPTCLHYVCLVSSRRPRHPVSFFLLLFFKHRNPSLQIGEIISHRFFYCVVLSVKCCLIYHLILLKASHTTHKYFGKSICSQHDKCNLVFLLLQQFLHVNTNIHPATCSQLVALLLHHISLRKPGMDNPACLNKGVSELGLRVCACQPP